MISAVMVSCAEEWPALSGDISIAFFDVLGRYQINLTALLADHSQRVTLIQEIIDLILGQYRNDGLLMMPLLTEGGIAEMEETIRITILGEYFAALGVDAEKLSHDFPLVSSQKGLRHIFGPQT
jgi:hypothetical protein